MGRLGVLGEHQGCPRGLRGASRVSQGFKGDVLGVQRDQGGRQGGPRESNRVSRESKGAKGDVIALYRGKERARLECLTVSCGLN